MKTFNRMLSLVGAVCLLLGGAVPGFAQKQAPPAGGPPKPFTVPARQVFTLPNGIPVTLVPYGTTPKVTIEVVVRTGAIDEAANQVWLADLTGRMMKEGTTSRSAQQLANDIADMGGAVEIGAGADETTIATDVLTEFGQRAVELLADVAQHPLLPESELARLKNDAVRRLTIAKSQPSSLANERFRKLLYADHPYGRIFPTAEMINGYTIEDVRKFYANNFGAARTRIYVAGKFDAAVMKKAITDAFATWKKGAAPVINVPKTAQARKLDVIDRPGAAQSTLYVGLPVIDPSNPDYVPLMVTNALLGGSFASRITINIREQKGYTYSPRSIVSTRYRDGYWVEMADVTTAVTGPSLKEIFGEIEKLRTETPTGDELTGIKNYLAGTFVLQNSSRQGLIGQLAFADLHQLGPDFLKTFVQKVHAVTVEQVRDLAKQYIQPDKMVVVVGGDQQKIADQLTPYATSAGK